MLIRVKPDMSSLEAERDAESEKLVDDVNQRIARLKMGPQTQPAPRYSAPISVESPYTLRDVDRVLSKLKPPRSSVYSSSSVPPTGLVEGVMEIEGGPTGSAARSTIRKKPVLRVRVPSRDYSTDPDEDEMEFIRKYQSYTAPSSKPPLPPVRPKIETMKDVKSMTDEIKNDMVRSYNGLKKGDPQAAKETLLKYKDRVELVEKYARQLGVSI